MRLAVYNRNIEYQVLCLYGLHLFKKKDSLSQNISSTKVVTTWQ